MKSVQRYTTQGTQQSVFWDDWNVVKNQQRGGGVRRRLRYNHEHERWLALEESPPTKKLASMLEGRSVTQVVGYWIIKYEKKTWDQIQIGVLSISHLPSTSPLLHFSSLSLPFSSGGIVNFRSLFLLLVLSSRRPMLPDALYLLSSLSVNEIPETWIALILWYTILHNFLSYIPERSEAPNRTQSCAGAVRNRLLSWLDTLRRNRGNVTEITRMVSETTAVFVLNFDGLL